MNYSFTNLYEEKRARTAVNRKLQDAGRKYWETLSVPLHAISGWLIEEGFTGMADGIYCGVDGSVHEQVGPHTWIALQWHKMESGRFEINAYLS